MDHSSLPARATATEAALEFWEAVKPSAKGASKAYSGNENENSKQLSATIVSEIRWGRSFALLVQKVSMGRMHPLTARCPSAAHTEPLRDPCSC